MIKKLLLISGLILFAQFNLRSFDRSNAPVREIIEQIKNCLECNGEVSKYTNEKNENVCEECSQRYILVNTDHANANDAAKPYVVKQSHYEIANKYGIPSAVIIALIVAWKYRREIEKYLK